MAPLEISIFNGGKESCLGRGKEGGMIKLIKLLCSFSTVEVFADIVDIVISV